jgi:drug/metabolite transporter (DMT)-like permease
MMPAAGSISSLVAVLWVLNVVLDTGGQLAFKAAANAPGDGLARWLHMARRPWLWLGIGCYVIEFLIWIAFLSLLPLSEAILLGSINIVAVMVAGRLLFGEKLTRLRVAGILLVTLGVAIVGVAG